MGNAQESTIELGDLGVWVGLVHAEDVGRNHVVSISHPKTGRRCMFLWDAGIRVWREEMVWNGQI